MAKYPGPKGLGYKREGFYEVECPTGSAHHGGQLLGSGWRGMRHVQGLDLDGEAFVFIDYISFTMADLVMNY
jgi:hypothetical protein